MTENKSFRKTPIPHRSKFGEPMVYYVLSEDGKEYTRITRSECLGSGNLFVDDEAGIVIRLPDNEMGEKYARMNMRSNWREQKQRERRFQCVLKETSRCTVGCAKCPIKLECESKHKESGGLDCVKKCEFCNIPNKSRTIELDRGFNNEDKGSYESEPMDPIDFTELAEDKALLDILHSALSALTEEDQRLIEDIFWNKKTERELAPKLDLKQPKSVNKRKHRILKVLRENEDLKSFFS